MGIMIEVLRRIGIALICFGIGIAIGVEYGQNISKHQKIDASIVPDVEA